MVSNQMAKPSAAKLMPAVTHRYAEGTRGRLGPLRPSGFRQLRERTRPSRTPSSRAHQASRLGRSLVGHPLPLLAAFAVLGLITACHRSASQGLATTPSEGHERTLRRGNGAEPDSLDPQKARTTEAQTILRDLFECLTSLDHDGRPAPGGAESWRISPAGKTYTFALRTNARWSNGDRVTGADFVAGLRRLVDPATASENGMLIDVIRHARDVLSGKLAPDQLGVSAPDDMTVVIELDHPATYLPGLLSHPSTCPVHRPTLARGDNFARPGAMVSNGAFVLSEWVPGQYIAARRNRFYRDDARTYWDRVLYLHITDESAEFLRYRVGEIDITYTIPRSQISLVRRDFSRELHVSPMLGTYYYGFNLDRAPFRGNLKLRQALNLAIDRERLVQSVLRTGEPAAYSWVPRGVDHYAPPLPAYHALTPAERVNQARQSYQDAGYSTARPLHVELRYNVGEIHTKLAIAIAQMWKETLGAEVQLTTEEFRALLNDVDIGQVELFRSGWQADYNDALAFLQVLRSDSGVNLTHYRSAAFDALLDHASSASDATERAVDLQEAERIALEDVPVIPIYFYVSKQLVKPAIRGWYDNRMNAVYSKDLSFVSAE
ncbi:MAG: oppA 3 [Gammaproteobacteria bacterium]|nr:oppA 3 [Gammaproteobacteria bacterium]